MNGWMDGGCPQFWFTYVCATLILISFTNDKNQDNLKIQGNLKTQDDLRHEEHIPTPTPKKRFNPVLKANFAPFNLFIPNSPHLASVI